MTVKTNKTQGPIHQILLTPVVMSAMADLSLGCMITSKSEKYRK